MTTLAQGPAPGSAARTASHAHAAARLLTFAAGRGAGLGQDSRHRLLAKSEQE